MYVTAVTASDQSDQMTKFLPVSHRSCHRRVCLLEDLEGTGSLGHAFRALVLSGPVFLDRRDGARERVSSSSTMGSWTIDDGNSLSSGARSFHRYRIACFQSAIPLR